MKRTATTTALTLLLLAGCGSATAPATSPTSASGNAGCNASNSYCLSDPPKASVEFNMQGELKLFAKGSLTATRPPDHRATARVGTTTSGQGQE